MVCSSPPLEGLRFPASASPSFVVLIDEGDLCAAEPTELNGVNGCCCVRTGIQGDAHILLRIVRFVLVAQVNRVACRVECFNVQAQRAHFLDEDPEGLWNTRFRDVFTLDNGFVDLDTSNGVVRLDGEQLLEGVGGTVGLQCPHLHLAEALATELGFTTQRLLRNHRVRAG